jgi:hypothetical protein
MNASLEELWRHSGAKSWLAAWRNWLLPEDQGHISRKSVKNPKNWWPRPAKNDSAHW